MITSRQENERRIQVLCREKCTKDGAGIPPRNNLRTAAQVQRMWPSKAQERGNMRDETRDSRGEHMVVITKKDGDNNDADDEMRPDPKFVIRGYL